MVAEEAELPRGQRLRFVLGHAVLPGTMTRNEGLGWELRASGEIREKAGRRHGQLLGASEPQSLPWRRRARFCLPREEPGTDTSQFLQQASLISVCNSQELPGRLLWVLRLRATPAGHTWDSAASCSTSLFR